MGHDDSGEVPAARFGQNEKQIRGTLVIRVVGILAAEHARDRLMYPRIDLEVAIFFRGQPEFNRAVAADKGLLAKTRCIFYGNTQQPLRELAAADRAVKFVGM
ncbi:MAG: hypothetical protein ACREQH_12760 [Candidatus Binatus sp.]